MPSIMASAHPIQASSERLKSVLQEGYSTKHIYTQKRSSLPPPRYYNEVPNPSFIILCVLRLVVVFYHLYLFPLLLRAVISCRDPGGSAPRDISQRLRATVSSGRTGGPCVEDS